MPLYQLAPPAETLIQTQVVSVAAQTLNFAGLDGEVQGWYRLIGHFKNGTPGVARILALQPNGLGANGFSQQVSGTGAVTGAAAFNTDMYLGQSASNDWVFDVMLQGFGGSTAPTPMSRMFTGTLITGTGAANGQAIRSVGGIWADATTKMTSLLIASDFVTGIGVGSRFSLFRVNT